MSQLDGIPVEKEESKEFPLTEMSMEALTVWMKTLVAQTNLLKMNSMLLKVILFTLQLLLLLTGIIVGLLVYSLYR